MVGNGDIMMLPSMEMETGSFQMPVGILFQLQMFTRKCWPMDMNQEHLLILFPAMREKRGEMLKI